MPFPWIALPISPVLPGLVLRILRSRPRLRIGGVLAIAGGCRLPGCGVETGLLQPRSQCWQVFTQFPGQTAIGGTHGYVNVAAALRHSHFDPRLSRSAYLEFDVVSGRSLDGRGRGIGLRRRCRGRRFGRGGTLCQGANGKRLDIRCAWWTHE